MGQKNPFSGAVKSKSQKGQSKSPNKQPTPTKTTPSKQTTPSKTMAFSKTTPKSTTSDKSNSSKRSQQGIKTQHAGKSTANNTPAVCRAKGAIQIQSNSGKKFTVTRVSETDLFLSQKRLSRESLDIPSVITFECGDTPQPSTPTKPLSPSSPQTVLSPNQKRTVTTIVAIDSLKPGPGLLPRAQSAKFTATGVPVNSQVRSRPPTKAHLIAFGEPIALTGPPNLATLNEEPFEEMSIITEGLALTSAGGVYKENLTKLSEAFGGAKVMAIFNVTADFPLIKFDGATSWRIPVADDPREQLKLYFDEVTEKIEQVRKKGGLTVVHGWEGVNRSVAIVLAYLLRYQSFTLEEAYRLTKQRRRIARPKAYLLAQLTDYEASLHGVATVWSEHVYKGIIRRMPNFIMKYYKEFYYAEFGTPHFALDYSSEQLTE